MNFKIKSKKPHYISGCRATDEQKEIFDRCIKEIGGDKTDAFCYLLYYWNENSKVKVKRKSKNKDDTKENLLEDNFSHFYEVYPKKTDKQRALKIWKTLNPNDDLFQRIINHCQKAYIGREKKFVPAPSTYLNLEKWEDEIVSQYDFVESQAKSDDILTNSFDEIRNTAKEIDSHKESTVFDQPK